MKLDVNFIRSLYPVFKDPESSQWAFFENAGGSYVPRPVINRLNHFFRYTKVQPYGLYPSSIKAGDEMDAGYRCMAELLNIKDEELTLGPSTTMNLYVLAQAVRPLLHEGDEIIVTNQDHEANIGCWRRLGEFGIKIREWQIDPETGELDVEDLKNLITSRTRLVCFTLCSNIVGTMNDVKKICDLAHDAGALAIGDGVSFAPHRIIDAGRLGVDIYLFSTYKTFGTHVGVMWGKEAVLSTLKDQGHYFNADSPHYRLNPAGPLHAEIAALAGIGEYYQAIFDHHFNTTETLLHEKAGQVFNLFSEHEMHFANQILEALNKLPGFRIIGQKVASLGRRASTISFVHKNKKSSEIVKSLANRKIAVRNGHFYALRCVKALGIKNPEEGVVRISLVHYNSESDVCRLIDGLTDVINT